MHDIRQPATKLRGSTPLCSKLGLQLLHFAAASIKKLKGFFVFFSKSTKRLRQQTNLFRHSSHKSKKKNAWGFLTAAMET